MRNFAHPFQLPEFQQSEAGIVEPLSNSIDSSYSNKSRYGNPRQFYSLPIEQYQSSLLQSAFSYYRSGAGIPPNWIYCRSPEIALTPEQISWWFFVLDSCKTHTLVQAAETQPQAAMRKVFYRIEMQNGRGTGNLFRRQFSVDEFGSLETALIFWVASIATLFIGGWILSRCSFLDFKETLPHSLVEEGIFSLP